MFFADINVAKKSHEAATFSIKSILKFSIFIS